jgi:hypothetical protein
MQSSMPPHSLMVPVPDKTSSEKNVGVVPPKENVVLHYFENDFEIHFFPFLSVVSSSRRIGLKHKDKNRTRPSKSFSL